MTCYTPTSFELIVSSNNYYVVKTAQTVQRARTVRELSHPAAVAKIRNPCILVALIKCYRYYFRF